jgi:predicted phage terminase large subunit-like protein
MFTKYWGDRFEVTQTGVGKLANDKTGWKLATSVDGVGTGERGDRVLLDDLISVKQADSPVVRGVAQRYIRETLPTRMNDPQASAIVAIEQRTHEDDATGTLLSDGGDYTHLMIPMELDERRCETSIGWREPRTVEDLEPGRNDRQWWEVRGELCFPERFPAWVVERDKRAMGQYAVASQFQQLPVPRGGAIIRDDWWQPWDPVDVSAPKFPRFDFVVAWVDGAFTERTVNDPTAMAVLGTFTEQRHGMPKVMLIRCWADRMALNDAVQRIDETARRYKVNTLLVENKATGYSVVQELGRVFQGKPYSITMTDPRGSVAGRRGYDKVSRVMSVVPLFEDGMVYAPRVLRAGTDELAWPEWCEDTIREISLFPRGRHDDRCDAVTSALRWMRDNGMLMREVEAVEADRLGAMADDRAGRLQPLYRT